jgi:hypothetical protein
LVEIGAYSAEVATAGATGASLETATGVAAFSAIFLVSTFSSFF